jgi:hypothetical protein
MSRTGAKLLVTVAEARKLLGYEMVLGHDEITNAFEFEIEESEIPPIPYYRESYTGAVSFR